ncbi:MAG TPA: carboxymuconolactone decarboxylase family protein [Fimbriimonas sp.]|nr:carboxymuconolactone decarboxylase family protein [Fimbriimonas sp.]
MSNRLQYRIVAREGMEAMLQPSRYLEHCSIDSKLRRLVELRVSQINGCLYCCDLHSNQLREEGECQQRLDILPAWDESTFFSNRERAALRWAEEVTLVSETHVSDGAYEEVRKEFEDRELVDLTFIVANMNALNRLAVSFRSQPPRRQ